MRNSVRIISMASLAVTLGLTVGKPGSKTESDVSPTSAASELADASYSLVPIPFAAIHHGKEGIPHIPVRQSVSQNWSGYAVPLHGSDTFSDVEGTWTVPTVTGAKRGSNTYSSIWVGIDGYETETVEQIGTEQDWTPRGQSNYAWFEMYPSGAYLIRGFPVNAGDVINAEVKFLGNGTFQLSIQNVTRRKAYTAPSRYTTSSAALRQSAEWIVEAPWSGRVLPLANFGTAFFSGCNATGASGIPAEISAWSSDPLTMDDPNGGSASPSVLSEDGSSFSVNWSP